MLNNFFIFAQPSYPSSLKFKYKKKHSTLDHSISLYVEYVYKFTLLQVVVEKESILGLDKTKQKKNQKHYILNLL